MDETWLYHYDLDTKQQLMECDIMANASPKNSERKNPLPSNFRDQDGILLVDYVSKGQTVNAEYYSGSRLL
jgi:hypothetical protein